MGPMCWGFNDNGGLGDGTTTGSATPVAVSGLTNAIAIGAWGRHSCALPPGRDGCLLGRQCRRQLGNGTTTDSSTPVPVSSLVGATALAQGGSGAHTCAFFAAGGAAVCWGENIYGQLGNGLTTDSSVPVAVSNLQGAAAIAAGQSHTCVLLPGDSLACWGNNVFGQLGDGTTTNRATPLAVSL